jgi:hypothetical protein
MSVADGGKQGEQTEKRALHRRIISSCFNLLLPCKGRKKAQMIY